MPLAHSFDQYFAWVNCQEVALPYHFGGATQSGRLAEHSNNQDAMSLWARTNCIASVIADGCSTSMRGFSNNEVGAKLLSTLVVSLVGESCVNLGVASLLDQLPTIEIQVCERILQLASTLLPACHQEDVLHNLFMTTILGLAIDEKDYAVFGCGDGLFSINGEVKNLDEFSGRYLAGRLLVEPDWRARIDNGDGMLRIHKSGSVEGLKYVLLASDGFESIYDTFPALVEQFLSEPNDAYKGRGYVPWMAADFRGRFWHLGQVQSWASLEDSHDDRSFVLLRRISEVMPPGVETCKEARTECSALAKPTAIDAADSFPH